MPYCDLPAPRVSSIPERSGLSHNLCRRAPSLSRDWMWCILELLGSCVSSLLMDSYAREKALEGAVTAVLRLCSPLSHSSTFTCLHIRYKLLYVKRILLCFLGQTDSFFQHLILDSDSCQKYNYDAFLQQIKRRDSRLPC